MRAAANNNDADRQDADQNVQKLSGMKRLICKGLTGRDLKYTRQKF